MKSLTKGISALVGLSMLGAIGIGALSTSTAGASTPTATPTPTPSTNPSCGISHDGGWPAFTNGEPAGFGAGEPAGDYIWHGADGWHLRVTHANDHHQTYTGVITTAGTFENVAPVKLEGNDSYWVGPGGHTIAFRFTNYGGVDGLDFRTDCAPSITFNLGADGHELDSAHVWIGSSSTHPTSVPFTIQRNY